MESKWCSSGPRDGERKVFADPDGDGDAPGTTDESRVSGSDVGAEMEPVAENRNGVCNWERPDASKPAQNAWRHLKHVEIYEKDHTIRVPCDWVHCSPAEALPQWQRLFRLLGNFLPLKTSHNDAVELTDFATDLGNEDCTLQPL